MYILYELIVVSYLRGGYGLILPYMGMDCQFISLYGEFVTSLSAYYSHENISTYFTTFPFIVIVLCSVIKHWCIKCYRVLL